MGEIEGENEVCEALVRYDICKLAHRIGEFYGEGMFCLFCHSNQLNQIDALIN